MTEEIKETPQLDQQSQPKVEEPTITKDEPSEPSESRDESPILATDFEDLNNLPDTKPELMSKSQWKKLQRKKKFQETKKEYTKIRKEKKKQNNAARREEIKSYIERNEKIPDHLIKKRPRKPTEQTKIDTKIIIDCSFDHLMNDKEKISLSSQITRAYSANRFSPNTVDLQVSSFGGWLKKRFEVDMKSSAYQNWTHMKFNEDPFAIDDKETTIYLSADSDETLEELKPNHTYIIGGIVDKGRYKYLCRDKAQKLGLKCQKLPIDQYINLFGRQVLTTTHVVELMLEWFNTGKDWKAAFEKILPSRKLLGDKEDEGEDEDEVSEVASVEGVEDEPKEELKKDVEEESKEEKEEAK
ncbi:tRNA (guanine-N(1)-)-methyltransferase [Wickerhamomyces ciferrii]|uniref:tRNA (guanine(9)-N1)-methyltransferase n=1 Tax=Wickerhamomyces ciferrii (strain ATCC 14091 / BCRC 22168 / CBS 111 / JCM 3599 / NBRC 0793 / NRRL Y-1031 F-60-10) TaxID=1206466 RepID=K0KKP6_WICCF|nr:tRNA (guanine-N(1)-)-methyltransferase [Wickerhamomyces ciferrii]CCH42727.1 tRNA (guanine-N(1)-)-methyltransferase [Wickerhamomyces ciferrii]